MKMGVIKFSFDDQIESKKLTQWNKYRRQMIMVDTHSNRCILIPTFNNKIVLDLVDEPMGSAPIGNLLKKYCYQSYLKDRPLNFLFYVRIVPCFQKEGKLHSVINLYSLILTFQNRKINTHILPLTSKKNIIALHIFYLVYQGEVTVQSFLRRHNCNKKILEEKLDHKHLADLLCHTDFYEVLYLLACGRIQQYKFEIRVYLMKRHDVYRFYLIKTFCLFLIFTNFNNNLHINLSWV
ncbi:hypothetical protein RIR_jg12715.t1 [Rhizophagus irregularis DAOM 181602=DAOM 197198]|nr:hypothetical protein RIR_jg12715.t1 [Rhizophagus irregularis DAOM 181602=DAOM 197198]